MCNALAGGRLSRSCYPLVDVKSGGRLSEKAMPENGCRGPAKLKEVAHQDTNY